MDESEVEADRLHSAKLAVRAERDALRAALKELVDLKDMRACIDRGDLPPISDGNYYTRKPLAWERARKLLEEIK